MIKIIAILDNSIGAGGGYDQALNAIVQIKKLSRGRFNFEVVTTHKVNLKFLRQIDITATTIKVTAIDKLIAKISQNGIWHSIQYRLRIIGPLEKKLIHMGCDLVYFLTPSNLPLALQKLNYINTAWDFCHRETPEFPEVRNFNIFSIREKIYKTILGGALFTLTDSHKSSKAASNYYGVDQSRFVDMPFGASPLLEGAGHLTDCEVLEKYTLKQGYFFYPAQFWAHKNHIRILQALIILRNKYNWRPVVVFSGRDYGNLGHIKKFIKNYDLVDQVKVLGFVPHEDLKGLYQNSVGVVMPTYFGPTNLPPLEAWNLGVPLIYSAEFYDQAKGAAILVNPDDANELSDALYSIQNLDLCNHLKSAGKKRLEEIEAERKVAEKRMCQLIESYSRRRESWGEI